MDSAWLAVKWGMSDMMNLANLKNQIIELQNGPIANLLGIVSTAALSLRRRSLTLVYRDRDGDWINSQREGITVSPQYRTIAHAEIAHLVQELWCVTHEIGPGDVVIDVGAGIGDEALILSRLVGETGQVIAIEPHPRTFQCLTKTIAKNAFSNVTALNLAVSDHEHETLIEDGELHIANRIGANCGFPVRARTLDNILGDLNIVSPTLVKLNIEGAEVAALRGASNALRRAQHWMISCHDFIADQGGPEFYRTRSNVTALLRSAGLQVREPFAHDDFRDRPWIPYYLYASRADNA
jgi:FkbM family methyltransferase